MSQVTTDHNTIRRWAESPGSKPAAVKATQRLPIDWSNLIFLLAVHVLAVGGFAAYAWWHGITLAAVGIGVVWTVLTVFSISAGYHRLFSHRTYEAHPLFRLFLLAFAAGSFQNSALLWAAQHRRHHARTDTDLDPYNARRGLWYSHVGWVVEITDPAIAETPVPDLEADPLIRWQHKHYVWIGIAMGLVAPMLLGWAFGDIWGGLVVGGFIRLVVVYQATFAVNSLSHTYGVQPYSDRNSSRDSLLGALVTMGEGYHNFHHAFPGDYRNGVRMHHFDPTKWIVYSLSFVGMTRKLRRTPPVAVIRAQVRMQQRRLEQRVASGSAEGTLIEKVVAARATVEEALTQWQSLVKRYEAARNEAGQRCSEAIARRREECRSAQANVRRALSAWQRVLRIS